LVLLGGELAARFRNRAELALIMLSGGGGLFLGRGMLQMVRARMIFAGDKITELPTLRDTWFLHRAMSF
jgi:hypothetical protein